MGAAVGEDGGFGVATGEVLGVGVGVGVGVGEGVATAHAATVKIAVLEMVTWLLAPRMKAVKDPPPARATVAVTFWFAAAVTFVTTGVPPADGVTTICIGSPGVTKSPLMTACPHEGEVAVTIARELVGAPGGGVDGGGVDGGGGGGVSPVPLTAIGAVGPEGATGIAPASAVALLKYVPEAVATVTRKCKVTALDAGTLIGPAHVSVWPEMAGFAVVAPVVEPAV